MRIGILAQYLDSRNDIRELILSLNQNNEVIVFLSKKDLAWGKFLEGVEIRTLNTQKPKNLKNLFLRYLFMAFGKIPKSKQNYFFTEYTKIKHPNVPLKTKVEKKVSLFLSKIFPCFLSYDSYLNQLNYNSETKIEDIDIFLCFTEIYDDYFLAQLLNSDKKVFTYVYSWDHPCKMKTFSKRIFKYLVWNEGLKEDLINLQNIDRERIEVFGSTQLTYINEYKKLTRVESNFEEPNNYLYFGCAFGHSELVPIEVKYIEEVAKVLKESFPEIKMVVRPYPFLKLWELYQPLAQYSNILFDNQYRSSSNDFSLNRTKIFDKFSKIENALAFLHLGTTMGFEATYFNVPVLHLIFEITGLKTNIKPYIHQYHNEKYLIKKNYPNVIQTLDELKTKLNILLNNNASFMDYNKNISQMTELKSTQELAISLKNLMGIN